jgi:hypothetical protein
MRFTCVFIVLTFAAGCGGAAARREGPIELAVPGRANAHVTLAADGDGVAAAWAASTASGTDVYAAFSADGGRSFGAPVRVNDLEGDASANGEQPPRVLLRGTSVDVLWVSKRDGVAGIRAAASVDGGATFAAARSITTGGLTGPRGWESAALADDGTVHAVWLDGRNAVHASNTPHASSAPHAPGAPHVHHGAPRQDIYHAMWRGDERAIESAVASNVCFCCKTAIVSRGRDVYVAWRHLFPGGVRDIAVARSADGGATFSAPVRVSDDNWKLDACPDDGPALTLAAGGALHVVWPTLVTDGGRQRMAIFEAASRDGGATFSPRARVDDAKASPAHPRIATGGAQAAIVWDELAEGNRRVMFRSDRSAQPAALSTTHVATYPALAAVRDGYVVAWTDQSGDRSVIQTRRVR